MEDLTRAIADYVDEKGISIVELAKKTGIRKGLLYSSLSGDRRRQLKVGEYFKICEFLEILPSTGKKQGWGT